MGYFRNSMSINAILAYQDGEMPLSKWDKITIIAVVESLEERTKFNFDIEELKKVSTSILSDKLLKNCGWHHTSKNYNKTKFYGINTEVLKTLTDDIIKQWIIEGKEEVQVKEKIKVKEEK